MSSVYTIDCSFIYPLIPFLQVSSFEKECNFFKKGESHPSWNLTDIV